MRWGLDLSARIFSPRVLLADPPSTLLNAVNGKLPSNLLRLEARLNLGIWESYGAMSKEFIPSDYLYRKRQSADQPEDSRESSIKRYHTYKLPSGKEEVVDFLKMEEEGGHCPHTVDVPGAYIIKGCKLQPTIHSAEKGIVRGHATCSPRGYINHWKECPYRKQLEGGAE